MLKPKAIFPVMLLISLITLLVACDPENEVAEQPSTVIPTITILPPILTGTPRFTATLPPTATFTPSETSTPSDTPTPVSPTATFTATATPPVIGTVVASNAINVRGEPSFQAEIIAAADPSTPVEVHYADETGAWIFIRFIDTEGNTIEGWMDARYLEWGGEYAPPTFGPSPTMTATIDPNITPSPTLVATVSAETSDENVRANCNAPDVNDPPPAITATDTVSIWWWWYAQRPELLDDHIQHATYEILLDGRLLEAGDYTAFQTEFAQERVEGRNEWVVYWYIPVGTLAPGRHEVTYRLTWDAEISDGYATFGPDTPDSSNCVFIVSE